LEFNSNLILPFAKKYENFFCSKKFSITFMQKFQKLQSTWTMTKFFSFFARKFFAATQQSHGINSIINSRNDHNNKQAINSILKSKINME